MGLFKNWFGGSPPPESDVFHGLRNRALNVTTADLRVVPDPNAPIHAVIMETGFPDAIATFACFADGSASLYLSTGGGVIGGGEHESVRAACLEMLSLTNRYAQDFLAACERLSTFALPRQGEVFFYLVTGDGVYQARCKKNALSEQRDPFSALFNNCHAVMSAVREIEEQR